MIPDLEILRAHGTVASADVAFARTLARLCGETRIEVIIAAALACRAVSDGDVCIDLQALGAHRFVLDENEHAIAGLSWPAAPAWLQAIATSPLVARPETSLGTAAPLVLDTAGRLYLERYWYYEQQVATLLLQRAKRQTTVDAAWLSVTLDQLGLEVGAAPPNWQRVAAALALRQGLCVISGGPGTGKTYTVAKILALLVTQAIACGESPPRVALLAPTGKAAARLSESIRKELPQLTCTDAVRDAIPTAAATLHRHLGLRDEQRFADRRERKLADDVVIVDEASMIDIGLLWNLLDALAPKARLILLGDRDQLASVDAGTVLSDLCAPADGSYSDTVATELEPIVGTKLPRRAASAVSAIGDCMVELRENRRFRSHPGIGRLAAAINAGDADAALLTLCSEEFPEVDLVEAFDEAELVERACRHFVTLQDETDALAKLRVLERFRILCAHRAGSYGVARINDAVEHALVRQRYIDADSGDMYPGRPILIERNDYATDLFNGDLGLILEGSDGAANVAAFLGSDGVRTLALSRLPAHATVFAMTIHKSQGSEFDEVAILLPGERSRVLTRELLYTAVTRAKSRVRIYAGESVLRATIAAKIRRASGLQQRLWENKIPAA